VEGSRRFQASLKSSSCIRSWGYYPSGTLGLLLVILLILVLLGQI
jgi:hypothetical protein